MVTAHTIIFCYFVYIYCYGVIPYLWRQATNKLIISIILSELAAAEQKPQVYEVSPMNLDDVDDDQEPHLDLIVPGQEVDKVSKLDNILNNETVWLDKLEYDPLFEASLIQEGVLRETWASKIRAEPNKREEVRKFLKFVGKFKTSKVYDAIKKALTDTKQDHLVEYLEGRPENDADNSQSGKLHNTYHTHTCFV